MPHARERHLQAVIKKSLGFSGIVGVFGHRQVGKTTLVSRFGSAYATLDDPASLDLANADASYFLSEGAKKGLFVVDECQLAPPLFPALKEWVRRHPKPGQFLITGSVRFSSRRDIRESLTGRIISWELLPMDLSEAHEKPLPSKIPALLKSKSLDLSLSAASHCTGAAIQKTLSHGGLPGIFAVRDAGVRAQRFETMLNTLLERDLQLILKTTLSYSSLRGLLGALALGQCQPIEWSTLSRQARISVPSLKKLIQAFEAMYLIRQIPTEGSERKPVLFFEDQGEATHLASNRYDDSTQLLRFLYSELRHQTHYRPEVGASIFQFRNRGGALVPLCFRAGHSVLGIIPILSENPHPSALATARSFLRTYPESKLLYVHTGSGDRMIESRVRSLGVRYLV